MSISVSLAVVGACEALCTPAQHSAHTEEKEKIRSTGTNIMQKPISSKQCISTSIYQEVQVCVRLHVCSYVG